MSTTDVVIELPNHAFCVMMSEKRIQKEMSLRYLCQKVGTTSRSYMSEIEKGRYAPSFDVGLAICQALDIPVPIYIKYYKDYHEKKQQVIMEKQYTEWFETLPEEVAISLIELSPEESSQIHSVYYNREFIMA